MSGCELSTHSGSMEDRANFIYSCIILDRQYAATSRALFILIYVCCM